MKKFSWFKRKTIEILIILLFFQNTIQSFFPIFAYLDELLALFCLSSYVLMHLKKKNIKYSDLKFLSIMTMVFFIGAIGNIRSGYLDNTVLIMSDFLSLFKFFFIYLYMKETNNIFFNKVNIKKLIHNILRIVKPYIIILTIFVVVNLFAEINMNYGMRFGIRSFSFIFGTPGLVINQVTYSLIFLCADNFYNKNNNFIYYVSCILILLSTLRIRGIVLAFIFFMLVVFILIWKNRNLWLPTFIIGVTSIFIGYSQFITYFIESPTPRSRFVSGAVYLVNKFFPFGSGFGTFGSSIASDYYSPVYSELGFYNYYGMNSVEPLFLNDNYLQMIFGQLGILGGALFITFLGYYAYSILKNFKSLFGFGKVALLFFVFDIFFSSIQSSYLSHYSVVCLSFIFLICFSNWNNISEEG